MSGTAAFHYRQYQIEKNRQEAEELAYEKLSKKSSETLQRYVNFAENKWKNRNFLYKALTLGLEPIKLIVAKEILKESNLEKSL